jgi:hypothetical protein
MWARKRILATAVTVAAGLGLMTTPAEAATQSPYPNALVEYMASTRTLPYVRDNT